MRQDNRPELQEVVEKYDLRMQQMLNAMPIEDVRALAREIGFQVRKPPHLKLVK